MSNWLLQKTSN